MRILARPEKTKVEEKEIEPCRVRASRRGRSVPRSPRDPDSSEKGEERMVLRLWLVTRRRWEVMLAMLAEQLQNN